MGKGDMGTQRRIPKERGGFRPGGALQERIMPSDPPAFVSSASVISKSVQQRWKAGWEVVTEGGAAQGAWHWPPRVNLSLPSSACSDWRIWGRIGVEEFSQKEPRDNKWLACQVNVVYIHFIGKKNFYIKIFWQTVKSIHKCKYILLLKQ